MLASAVKVFADKGLGGASLREIAVAAGLTNASLLHHYPSKEALYGAVLERIADSLSVWSEPPDAGRIESRVLAIVEGYRVWLHTHDAYGRILMRELLDNHDRAAAARRWYLAPLVRRCADHLERAKRSGELRDIDAPMLVSQLIGAVAYFAVAEPTLRRIFEVPSSAELGPRFQASLATLVSVALRSKPVRSRR